MQNSEMSQYSNNLSRTLDKNVAGARGRPGAPDATGLPRVPKRMSVEGASGSKHRPVAELSERGRSENVMTLSHLLRAR